MTGRTFLIDSNGAQKNDGWHPAKTIASRAILAKRVWIRPTAEAADVDPSVAATQIQGIDFVPVPYHFWLVKLPLDYSKIPRRSQNTNEGKYQRQENAGHATATNPSQ